MKEILDAVVNAIVGVFMSDTRLVPQPGPFVGEITRNPLRICCCATGGYVLSRKQLIEKGMTLSRFQLDDAIDRTNRDSGGVYEQLRQDFPGLTNMMFMGVVDGFDDKPTRNRPQPFHYRDHDMGYPEDLKEYEAGLDAGRRLTLLLTERKLTPAGAVTELDFAIQSTQAAIDALNESLTRLQAARSTLLGQ